MDKILNKLFKLANKSLKKNEFPVAAIIYKDNKIISCGYNKRNKTKKTTDHAEIIAIEKANKKIKDWRLTNFEMIVTLEPCDMCKTVIKEARIKKVYYLTPRYNYKKQYKCTIFEQLDDNSKNNKEEKENISKFFKLH